jgi:ABC-type transporter Mla subunit MlaD
MNDWTAILSGMSELDDIRGEIADLCSQVLELATLRDEVAELREATAHSQALSAMADRGVAGLRPAILGLVRTQNALRETQLEQSKDLARFGAELTEHRTETRAGFQVLTGLITRLLQSESD